MRLKASDNFVNAIPALKEKTGYLHNDREVLPRDLPKTGAKQQRVPQLLTDSRRRDITNVVAEHDELQKCRIGAV